MRRDGNVFHCDGLLLYARCGQTNTDICVVNKARKWIYYISLSHHYQQID